MSTSSTESSSKVVVNLPVSTIDSASITNILNYSTIDSRLKLTANLTILKTAITTLDGELDKVITQVDANTTDIAGLQTSFASLDPEEVQEAIEVTADLASRLNTIQESINKINTFINVNKSTSTLTSTIANSIASSKLSSLQDVSEDNSKDSSGNTIAGSILTFDGDTWQAGDIQGGTF